MYYYYYSGDVCVGVCACVCVCVGGGGGGGWDGMGGGGGGWLRFPCSSESSLAILVCFLPTGQKMDGHVFVTFKRKFLTKLCCFSRFFNYFFNIYSIPVDIYVSLLGVSARFLFLNDFYSFCARLKFWREYF